MEPVFERLTFRIALVVFHIETNGKKTLAILDRTPHLSALRKVARVTGNDDMWVEGMAASFAVPILIV
jgi:hypothetical protein